MDISTQSQSIIRFELCKWSAIQKVWIKITPWTIYKLYSILRLPWNSSTLNGYIAEVFYVISSAGFYNTGNGCSILLFISICLNHQAFYKIIQNATDTFDVENNNRNKAIFLCELIKFHVSVKKLVKEILEFIFEN